MLKGVVVLNTSILIKGLSEVIRSLEPEGLGEKELEGTGASQAIARLMLGGEKFLMERRPRK